MLLQKYENQIAVLFKNRHNFLNQASAFYNRYNLFSLW